MSASSVEEAVKVVDQVLMDTLDMDPDIGDADIVLDALSAMPLASRVALARALVPGWAVVPREPTEAMQVAAYNAWADGPPLTIVGEAVATYRAMLTAAEEPPHGP